MIRSSYRLVFYQLAKLTLISFYYQNFILIIFTTHAHKLCLRTEKIIYIIRIFPADFDTIYSLPKVACDLILLYSMPKDACDLIPITSLSMIRQRMCFVLRFKKYIPPATLFRCNFRCNFIQHPRDVLDGSSTMFFFVSSYHHILTV